MKTSEPFPSRERSSDMELLYERADEPSQDRPIAYRERAFSVPPDLERDAIGYALASEFERVKGELSDARSMKYVRLAAFDHRFDERPKKAPIATVVWRDWKGKPQLEVAGAPMDLQRALSSPPPPRSRAIPNVEKMPPMRTIDVDGPARPAADAVSPSPLADVPVASVKPPTPEELEDLQRRYPPKPAQSGTKRNAIYSSRPPPPSSSDAATPNSEKVTARARRDPARAGQAAIAGSRPERGDDLVGAVFDCIHDLHFARDVAEGAQVLLDVVGEFLPCEGALVYVFDAGAKEYCAVRAAGTSSRDVLLQRVAADDDMFRRLSRGRGTFRSATARAYPHFRQERYQALVEEPRAVLMGSVRHGGRDLGMIELLNPKAGGSFQSNEESALEYLCSQFGEFLADRPIVLTEEALLRGARPPQ